MYVIDITKNRHNTPTSFAYIARYTVGETSPSSGKSVDGPVASGAFYDHLKSVAYIDICISILPSSGAKKRRKIAHLLP